MLVPVLVAPTVGFGAGYGLSPGAVTAKQQDPPGLAARRVLRTGSHNLIVGPRHEYTSFGGFVAGQENTVSGWFASIPGGTDNIASDTGATVSGGAFNVASGEFSTVSGGEHKTATNSFENVP
jgi:hypothetical protein